MFVVLSFWVAYESRKLHNFQIPVVETFLPYTSFILFDQLTSCDEIYERNPS